MSIFVFDLDNTLCSHEIDYTKASPFLDRIDIVNTLYDNDHTIIIDTARGSQTDIDWYEITKKQLDDWGVKYHKLRTGIKIYADYYIDDHGISDIDFFKQKV